MNVFHSCDGTNIFIRWKMKSSIQRGETELNGPFHLSPHENICTTALINIYYLYNNHCKVHVCIKCLSYMPAKTKWCKYQITTILTDFMFCIIWNRTWIRSSVVVNISFITGKIRFIKRADQTQYKFVCLFVCLFFLLLLSEKRHKDLLFVR